MGDTKEKKDFLYRILQVHRAKELFESGKLVFLKPDAWKDPFENYLSKVSFFDADGKTHHIDYLKKVYGQCYSLGTETSLMWDAYAPDRNGVRIKIEKDKLIEYIKSQSQYPASNFKFDKVTYKKYGDFISKLKDDVNLLKLYKKQNNKLLDYFFEKRYEYRDEREFRIMYDANNDSKSHGNLLKLKIPISDLIHSMRFDPKMPEKECDELREYFGRRGLDSRRIHRSLLYKYEVKKKVKL